MSSLTSRILAELATRAPDPTRSRGAAYSAAAAGRPKDHGLSYAREQFQGRVRTGAGRLTPTLWGKTVVEIGCGHGGVSCYLASVGARHVYGLDLNPRALDAATRIKAEIEEVSGRPLPVSFLMMDASSLAFGDQSIDLVFADNLFEHVMHPEAVLREAHRVLRPDGRLIAPTFSSMRSKWGPHLKHGLRLPWLGFFSEATLVDALKLRAEADPVLYSQYPGLKGDPHRLRDVRAHGDLNDMTYGTFRALAEQEDFDVDEFVVHSTPVAKLLRRILPGFNRSQLAEILSTGAGARLAPKRPPNREI